MYSPNFNDDGKRRTKHAEGLDAVTGPTLCLPALQLASRNVTVWSGHAFKREINREQVRSQAMDAPIDAKLSPRCIASTAGVDGSFVAVESRSFVRSSWPYNYFSDAQWWVSHVYVSFATSKLMN